MLKSEKVDDESTNLVIHAHGGHNGFVDGIFFKGWYEQKLADLFDTIVIEAGKQKFSS